MRVTVVLLCVLAVGLCPSEASFFDSLPFVSQLKSLIQVISGDAEGAKRTQENFVNTAPVVSQIKSAVQAARGDTEGAKNTQKQFAHNLEEVVDSTPVLGHIKGGVHIAVGDKEKGVEIIKGASSTTGSVIGGLLGGPAGAILGGAATDALITGIDRAVNKEAKPFGLVEHVVNFGDKDAGEHFDQFFGIGLEMVGGTAVKKPSKGGPKKPDSSDEPNRPDTPDNHPDTPNTRPDTPGTRPDTPDNRRDTADNRRDTPDNRPDTPGSQPDTPDTRPDTPDNRPDTPDNRPDTPDNRQDTPHNRPDTPDTRPDTPDNRPDTPDNRRDTPDNRRDTPDNRRDTPDNRRDTADNRRDTPDNRPDTPGSQPDTPDTRPDTPDNRPDTPDNRPDTPDNRQDTPHNRPDTPDTRPDTPDDRPDTPDNRRDTPDNRPDTPNNQPDTPDNRPDTPNNRPDTPDNHPDNHPDNQPDTPEFGAEQPPREGYCPDDNHINSLAETIEIARRRVNLPDYLRERLEAIDFRDVNDVGGTTNCYFCTAAAMRDMSVTKLMNEFNIDPREVTHVATIEQIISIYQRVGWKDVKVIFEGDAHGFIKFVDNNLAPGQSATFALAFRREDGTGHVVMMRVWKEPNSILFNHIITDFQKSVADPDRFIISIPYAKIYYIIHPKTTHVANFVGPTLEHRRRRRSAGGRHVRLPTTAQWLDV